MDHASTQLPRVTIQFCTQCKWMLRAAYFAQELLSTFGTALGEVALQPSTGGTFIVEIYHAPTASSRTGQDDDEAQESRVTRNVLWDRKVEGGFPETKELKRRVRDIIEPGRDLGHVDGKKKIASTESQPSTTAESEVEAGESTAPPKALGALQGRSAERKFTPMDVDGVGMTTEPGGDGPEVKRNADGGICEDCN